MRAFKSAAWTRAVKASPDPPRARHFLDLLAGTTARTFLAKASPEQARILAALFSGSQVLPELLLAHPVWIKDLTPEALKFPRRKQGLARELGSRLKPSLDARQHGPALAQLREFKQEEMLRIATRDLARLSTLPEIIEELSDVADICLSTVWEICYFQMVERYGWPYHQEPSGGWRPSSGCLLGLGKLGGRELNYSSDVDVVFVYEEEGQVFWEPPLQSPASRRSGGQRAGSEPALRPVLASHQFFNRLAEALIAEVTRLGPEGALYRIDLRLRPEGDAGPLSRSLAGYENYYAQWGQTWERMMLIKARCVAGSETLAAEFLELIQPFRYPRSVNERVLREIVAMKDRIENEVLKAGELERNVKLGRGGIREVEFIAQAFQLLHGGRQPFLQGPQTLGCLEKLVQYELLPPASARLLQQAYVFQRETEHRLQMENNRQTHTIPAERHAHARLARLMKCATVAEFDKQRLGNMENVRRAFDELLRKEAPGPASTSPFPTEFAGAEPQWKQLLAAHGFRDAEKALRVLREFVEGPGFVHVSARTSELAFELLPRLFALCPGARAITPPKTAGQLPPKAVPLSDPDRVLTRLDSFIQSYGARATLFELWAANPTIFELLVLLFDRSEFLAELAIRSPDLVDELVMSGRLRQIKTAAETLRDLRHGLHDADQFLWLRRYHQAELMRIGLRDILGLADFEQYLTELSALAEACLQYALESVTRRHKLKQPPFVIIGLGKLGGAEIDYGSDLDIVFVAPDGAKAKDLPRFSRLAVEVMELLSKRTEQGVVFHTDARLRPDGEKGLLVNTLDAYEEYYRRRAQLWEIQALTRARTVAGDEPLGAKFQTLAGRLTNFRQPPARLAAFTTEWKQKIHQMRMRIQNERTPRGRDSLAIKTGSGGLMDAEFVAQTLCLANGWTEPNTLRALQKGKTSGGISDAEKLIENYRRVRRIEGVLRRWSYEGETVLPHDLAPYYRVSVRCGFASPEEFRAAVASCRRAIREVYLKVFGVTG